jgi:hypothetical protein
LDQPPISPPKPQQGFFEQSANMVHPIAMSLIEKGVIHPIQLLNQQAHPCGVSTFSKIRMYKVDNKRTKQHSYPHLKMRQQDSAVNAILVTQVKNWR